MGAYNRNIIEVKTLVWYNVYSKFMDMISK